MLQHLQCKNISKEIIAVNKLTSKTNKLPTTYLDKPKY